ncbi:transcription factor TFIIH subunit p52/Tfb2 [Mycena rebaudengoi]|nr:transcription factor TFIIH subunit p52/Tfb2 [Mycena rebaudengoi]
MPSIQASTQAEAVNSPHSLLPFLQYQSETTLILLYQRPSSCLSILRLLEPLQQQIVMNLLWLESAITMAAWAVHERKKYYDTALTTLFRLHILSTCPIKLALNFTFRTSLRQALPRDGTTGSFDGLDGYALERWETILHYMPSADVLYLLQRSGLWRVLNSGSLQITSAGFQSLLHSPHAQLWDLLLSLSKHQQERGMDLVEVLSFLFILSTMDLGRKYSTEGMSGTQAAALTQKAMLSDLRDYGLLWQRKPSSRRFYPTRLATTVTSSSPPLPTSTGPSSGPKEGFVVLETNYRIYAYTDNPLQTTVLNLFVALKYRFPNLVVGSITQDSVKKALSNGISAEQIISYLIAHAHPQMRKHELEKNRLKSQAGLLVHCYLYTAFTSPAHYKVVLK